MISILVPIYNVENYLQRCINSVITQSHNDWELILVDDGSTDKSPSICDYYKGKDKRIKVIHKKNGGLPSARLEGFKNANGEYLIFLDSDDWLLPNSLTKMYESITSNGGYDIVRSLVERHSSNGEKWIEHYRIESGILEGNNTFLHAISGDSISPYLHSSMYRASLFSERAFEILIDNNISIGEDWFTNYYIAPKVKKVIFIDEPTFAYFVNSKSYMGGSVYGWEYYEKVERCKEMMNKELGIKETDDYKIRKSLMDLRYFFIPEVSFSWKHFKTIRPFVLSAIASIKEGNIYTYNTKHIKFIKFSFLYFIYTLCYRMFFWIFKLKLKSRKLIK